MRRFFFFIVVLFLYGCTEQRSSESKKNNSDYFSEVIDNDASNERHDIFLSDNNTKAEDNMIFQTTDERMPFSFDGSYDPNLYSTLDSFCISNGNIRYQYESEESSEIKTVKYEKIYKEGLLFLKMEERFPYSITENDSKSPTSNTLLVLIGKHTSEDQNTVFPDGSILFFAETAGFDYPYIFITHSQNFLDHIGHQIYKDCSSFLKENDIEYKIENLSNCKPGTPWVEGVSGSGIGEGFSIECERDYLLIMNGFISYDKPYLYKQNNRIKKLKVTGLKNGIEKTYEVLDTPHPQTIDVSDFKDSGDIRIEIADVYKGTKFDDTCMNFCAGYTARVIPYEDTIY